MDANHPLDHTIWSALSGRQSRFAIVQGAARRYDPEVGVFASLADRREASLGDLARLVAATGDVVLRETEEPPSWPGLQIVSIDVGVQMVETRPVDGPMAAFDPVALTDADAPQMLALALLTKPGPFFARTHELGGFIGIRIDGRLAAMAGERMKPDGYVEVSGVCVHPDFRGRGYAAGLTRLVAASIRARGDTPFLHAYATNAPAISLYRTLGYELRREFLMVRLSAA